MTPQSYSGKLRALAVGDRMARTSGRIARSGRSLPNASAAHAPDLMHASRSGPRTGPPLGGTMKSISSALRRRLGSLGIAAAVALLSTFGLAASAGAAGLVISQVYGGGGNSGATYKNDFI